LEDWRFKTPGQVISSAEADRGVAYLGDTERTLYSLEVSAEVKPPPQEGSTTAMFGSGPRRSGFIDTQALDRFSGVKWDFETIGERKTFRIEDVNPGYSYPDRRLASNGGIRSSPALADGALFFGSEDGHFYSVDAETGQENWSLAIERSKQQRGISPVDSSPAVAGGVVYFGSLGNHLYAVDTKSGQEKWRFRTEGGVFSSPLIADGVAYVGSWDWNVYAVDTATGRGDHFCGQR
jgi:outer membrane protein assembly factor BamB